MITERLAADLPELSAEAAAAEVPADATLVVSGFGSVGDPKEVPMALAESGRECSLTYISGGSVGNDVESSLVESGQMARRYPYQSSTAARAAANEGRLAYHDRHVSRLADEVQFGQLADADVAIVEAIAVGDGWFVPSTSLGQTPAYVEAADALIVELNAAQPLALQRVHDVYRPSPPPNREPIPLTEPDERIGSARIGFDPGKLVGVVRTDQRDQPYVFREPTEDDRAIAANLGGFLSREVDETAVFEDRVNLQFGVGSLGNALMGELSDVEFGDRDVAYYGEVIQDGLLDLLDAGMLTAASATTLALSAEGQDRFFADVESYADDVVVRPADVSNAPEVVTRLGVIAVNSALEVDVYGHVNSTHVNGSRVINGLGGSGDFNRNALISVTALPSTAAGGDLSRIVPLAPHVDHTEHDVDVIVTERGVADLRGLSPRERARTVVEECAHPDFQPALRDYLDRAREQGGHVPHDLETAFDWRD
ncbi:MAG: acetyl-CoA hydrolase/transferase C-terminal domain-containing protein [Haloarculaceae archaeon]